MDMIRKAYLDWPLEVSIETFSKCNARCTFCPYPTLDRHGTKMSDEMIDRIIDELKDHPGVFSIAPFKVNEPFLDKRLIPICRKINAELPNARIRLFTNGSALTEQNIAEVSALENVHHLWISLNDHDPVQYERTMGLLFERTARNLDYLQVQVLLGKFRHPVIISKVVERNERDREFCDYVHERWPQFHVHLIKHDAWIDYTYADDGEVPDTPCGRWFEMNIMADGKVALCCMDGEGRFGMGDLNTQSLFEAYNMPARRNWRLKLMSRKEVSHPCSGCTY